MFALIVSRPNLVVIICYSLLIFFIYRTLIVVHRYFFHPLAKFPGPRLAAVSTLYRVYYELWKDGKLLEQATELHKIYGKKGRITASTSRSNFAEDRAGNSNLS